VILSGPRHWVADPQITPGHTSSDSPLPDRRRSKARLSWNSSIRLLTVAAQRSMPAAVIQSSGHSRIAGNEAASAVASDVLPLPGSPVMTISRPGDSALLSDVTDRSSQATRASAGRLRARSRCSVTSSGAVSAAGYGAPVRYNSPLVGSATDLARVLSERGGRPEEAERLDDDVQSPPGDCVSGPRCAS
jgi:hypothetical protein